jgi:hypothetical protein
MRFTGESQEKLRGGAWIQIVAPTNVQRVKPDGKN